MSPSPGLENLGSHPQWGSLSACHLQPHTSSDNGVTHCGPTSCDPLPIPNCNSLHLLTLTFNLKVSTCGLDLIPLHLVSPSALTLAPDPNPHLDLLLHAQSLLSCSTLNHTPNSILTLNPGPASTFDFIPPPSSHVQASSSDSAPGPASTFIS